ncbi:MAG: DUF4179 domain-containing protein [Saccharofermentans sp.]|nr:DUF4179 domain-containing protein [Saccharofermentans sp.]
MDYKINYKSNVDSLCENNLKLTAEDILNSGATVTDLSGATKPMKKSKKLIALTAACVCTIGATGVMAGANGYGPLSTLFANKAAVESENTKLSHDDIISSYLAEQGYLLDINETQSAEGFDITFEGATGDWSNVQMLFTIRTDDEEFIASHDSINLTVYKGFNEEAFSERSDVIGDEVGSYGYDEVVAYKSAEDPSMYILTYGAYPYFVQQGTTIYTQIRTIETTPGSATPLFFTYTFTLPTEATGLADDHDMIYSYDEAMTYTDANGVEYHATEIIFSQYDTELICEYYLDGTDYEYIDDDFWGAYFDEAAEIYQETAKDLRLVVDGVEYEPSELSYVYSEDSGLKRVLATFPEVDFDNATSVAFTYNDSAIVVK